MKKLLSLLVAMLMVLCITGTALAEYTVNEELADVTTTLTMYGPGSWGSYEDTTDLVTGETTPGYHVIVERFAELYPNVTLEIEVTGWDSWQAAITTACLSGDVDIILHGATMTDLTLDLTEYLEADPEFAATIATTSSRRTTDNIGEYKVSGIAYNISPMVVWLDTEIFEHYGVELPDESWTFDDMLELAAQLTGTDPVTGEETYGVQLVDMGGSNLWVNYTLIANSLGATVFDYADTFEDTTVDFTTEESIAAFQMIADLAEYCSPEAKEGLAVTEALDGENNWAMLITEGLTITDDLEAYGTEDRYVCITVPVATAGRYEGLPSPYAGDTNMAIYKDSPDADLAWEFIKFLLTDEVAVEWLIEIGLLPNTVEAAETLSEYVDNENVVETYTAAMEAVPENYNNATNYVFNNISYGSVTNNLITAVDNVINGYMTAEEAAQYMQDGIDEYLANLEG